MEKIIVPIFSVVPGTPLLASTVNGAQSIVLSKNLLPFDTETIGDEIQKKESNRICFIQ
jgi:hypothetical protein